MNDPDVKIPGFQLGQGCLVDQLVGQYGTSRRPFGQEAISKPASSPIT